MEKSSQKLIGTIKPTQNPFNNLLSQVQINLNQPKSLKKIQNFALQIDPNIDRECSYIPESPTYTIHNSEALQINSRKLINKTHVINVPLPTKNSSDTVQEKDNKYVIYQWIIGYMQKRQILGEHWENIFQQKKLDLLSYSLQRIKGYSKDIIDSDEQKVINLWNILTYLQMRRVKDSFIILKQYYKDDILFGLSKTLEQEQNDGQIMLKVDSECGLSIQSRKIQKQKLNMDKSSETFSNFTKNKKVSQSLQVSQDLSALILNYNKIKLPQELNRSNPNISTHKNTQKLIDSTKQIAQISINTKKKLESNRKLSEGGSNNDLPLESKKNLVNNKNNEKNNKQPIYDSTPITMTMIIKQFENKQEHFSNQKKLIEDNLIKRNVIRFNGNCERQKPNKNQISKKQNRVIFPPRPNDNAKRSVSLQTKQKFYNLIVENSQKNITQINQNKIIGNREYYPEDCRQNVRFMKQTLPIYEQKVRPKSATPKITFTFSNNPLGQPQQFTNYQKISKKQENPSQINSHSGYNVEHDPILESIISPLPPQNNYEQKLIKNKTTKLMVISPSSRRPQSPKKSKAHGKLNIGQRQHIQNIILPSFDDYGVENSQKLIKSNPSAKVIVNNNQIIYKDLYHRSTAQNTVFPLSPRQSGINCCNKDTNRVKSPKDKIFVTFGNKYLN